MKPVIVIGTGFGGLAAAIRLRAMGHKVEVLEAGDQPGGRARVFTQDGFSFDGGPTVITAPYLLDELFTLVGRNPRDYYDLVPVDPFYRVLFADGSKFDYVGDEERILEQIAEMSPRDVDGYRAMAKEAEEIFNVGYLRLADQPFDKLSDMLRVVPDMIRLESWRSVYGMVSKHIRDPRLRQVFTFQPLLVGGNPYKTPSIYLLIHWLERKWGVWFPKGGTSAVVRGLVRLLGELDVPVRMNAAVEEIEVENGRATAVRVGDGTRIECSAVVSNADPTTVYGKLIAKKHRSKHTDGALGRRVPSMGLFVGYFGTNKPFPDVAHHTIVLGPRYEGLLTDIFSRKVLADDFSLYLHAPSRTDPSLAPPGHEAFYVLSPVPNQRSGIDWAEVGPAYYDRILESLEKRVLPGLRASMATSLSIDPRHFEGPLRSAAGAAFGLEPRLTQSAWFRFHNRSEDVEGLYFVGASTHPGAGVPGVLCSAKVLERVMERPEHPIALPGGLQQRAHS